MTRIGIIGCGHYGGEHARILAAMPGAELRAFCDTDAARAEALRLEINALITDWSDRQTVRPSDTSDQSDLSDSPTVRQSDSPTVRQSDPPTRRSSDQLAAAPYSTPDPLRVITDPAIDAVWICTHHDSHAPLAVAAAEARKHMLVEKPLALTLEDCDAIIAATDRAGVLCMTGFKFRFQPAVQALRARMPHPRLMQAHALDDRWPDDFWANDPVKGGGNVLSEGCHVMDLVSFLHGREPVRVHAAGGNFGHSDLDIVDTMIAVFTFSDGSVASVAIDDGGRPPVISKFAVTANDGTRAAHLSARLTELSILDAGRTHEQSDTEECGVREEDRAFLHAIESGGTAPCTARDGRRATAMVLAAFESVRTGDAVDMTRNPWRTD